MRYHIRPNLHKCHMRKMLKSIRYDNLLPERTQYRPVTHLKTLGVMDFQLMSGSMGSVVGE